MNEQNSKSCVHCGRQLSNTAVFCPGCGEKIASEEEEIVASPASEESTFEDKQNSESENGMLAQQSSETVVIHSSLAMKFLVRLLWVDVGLTIAVMLVDFSVNAFIWILSVVCLIWRVFIAFGLERRSEGSRKWCIWLAISCLVGFIVGGVLGADLSVLEVFCDIVWCVCGVLCLTKSVRQECRFISKGAK